MEIKPCPFCGGQARLEAEYKTVRVEGTTRYIAGVETFDTHDSVSVEVGCENDWCLGRLDERITFSSVDSAIEAWNTRHERTCRDVTGEGNIQAFTCSECGCWVAYDEYWETGIYVQTEGQPVHIHPSYCPNCGAKVVD